MCVAIVYFKFHGGLLPFIVVFGFNITIDYFLIKWVFFSHLCGDLLRTWLISLMLLFSVKAKFKIQDVTHLKTLRVRIFLSRFRLSIQLSF